MLPEVVLVDIKPILEEFLCTTVYMEFEDYILADVMRETFRNITNFEQSEFELAQAGYDRMGEYEYMDRVRDGNVLTEAIYCLGGNLAHKLKQMGLYRGNDLWYDLHSFSDELLVLKLGTRM